ncbi:DUF695 domain-containing protein [Acidicapsa dinghuensis]|uniref:DUF695 domain-containing protein n=1 Tax=Acidicapsa dinghuensis TaxID=2218256 RepID=A0ABW1EDP3_9BACT|nr:DUF695 domain-containing protein [Acidicapsa dinghuensis]
MWPFGRKPGKPSKDPQPTDWILGRGERDGFPMIVRMADAYSGLAPISGYDHHVIVSVRFRNPQPNGFPSSEECDELEMLEKNLSRLLETENECLDVLVVTNNGLRDFISYTRNVDYVWRKLEDNVSLFHGFVVEFAIEPDPRWDIYQAFCRMLGRTTSYRGSN